MGWAVFRFLMPVLNETLHIMHPLKTMPPHGPMLAMDIKNENCRAGYLDTQRDSGSSSVHQFIFRIASWRLPDLHGTTAYRQPQVHNLKEKGTGRQFSPFDVNGFPSKIRVCTRRPLDVVEP